jgi:hypothetical protein
MRIKGDRDGFYAKGAGTRDGLGDDPLMAAMDTVEVADGGDGWAEVRRNLCELAEDLHQAISNFICCPS